MSPLSVLLTLAAYFVILFTVSYLAGRKADNAGFFTGNRRSSWPVVAFAMIGASISGVTYVSVPGMVKDSGFGYLQMVLGFIAGQFIIAFVRDVPRKGYVHAFIEGLSHEILSGREAMHDAAAAERGAAERF